MITKCTDQRRKLILFVSVALCALACSFALSLAAAQSADARYSARSALRDLNSMRRASGLPRVPRARSSWSRGCKLHNRYMLRTGRFGHAESRSSRYYSRLGARTAARSVIAKPASLPTAAFGDTIYHRLAMLQPRLRRVGYSSSHGHTCLDVLSGISRSRRARSRSAVAYAWPADGTTGLDPVFDNSEWPDPRRDAPGARVIGTPISFAINGPWKYWQITKTRVTHATLISELGQVIPVSVSDADSVNGSFLQGGFAILPRQGLPANTWFTASASGDVHYRGRTWPISAATRFRTGTDGG